MSDYLIEIHNLTKAYGYLPVLKKLTLNVKRGQFVGVLGHNGSGKSTLLKLICGLNKPTAGVIRVGGWSMPKEAEAVRAQIGMVSHKSLLYENLTARENLRFFAQLYNVSDDAMIDESLNRVGLRKRAQSLVRTFSRGMQQRLSIARALLHNPQVLLFDEPYTGLDQDAGDVLDTLLRDAHREGRTILMATHQLERAAQLCDRIVIVHGGTIAYDDVPPEPRALIQVYANVTGAVTAR